MSEKYTLDQVDWMKITNNFFLFLSPVLMIYLGSISTLLDDATHPFTWNDLVPNQILLGMMVKQLIDTTIDVAKKWSQGPMEGESAKASKTL